MAFGRDGSELELEVYSIQHHDLEVALQQIISIVTEGNLELATHTNDSKVLKIAQRTLDRVVEIEKRLSPGKDLPEVRGKFQWSGHFCELNFNPFTSLITSQDPEFESRASMIIDLRKTKALRKYFIFDSIKINERKFSYTQTFAGVDQLAISGELIADDLMKLRITVIGSHFEKDSFDMVQIDDLARPRS